VERARMREERHAARMKDPVENAPRMLSLGAILISNFEMHESARLFKSRATPRSSRCTRAN